MAHPVWHTADQKSATGTDSYVVDRPDNVAEGDELVAVWMSRLTAAWNTGLRPPPGWSVVTGYGQNGVGLVVMRKRATASEPADYTFLNDADSGVGAVVVGRVTGLSGREVVEVVSTIGGTSTSMTVPEETGLRNEDFLRIAAFSCRTNSGTHTGVNVTSPGTFTEVYGDTSQAGFSAGVWVEDLSGTTASDVTATNTNTRWAALYIVFREPQAADDEYPTRHVGDQRSNGGTGTSLTADRPGNTSEGDLLIATWENRQGVLQASDFTVPSGWTLVGQLASAGLSDPSAFVWRKVAGGSEPADYTWSHSGDSNRAALTVDRVTGYDTTSPTGSVETGSAGAGDTFTVSDLTGITDDKYLRMTAVACRLGSGEPNGVRSYAPPNAHRIFDTTAEGFAGAVEAEYLSGTTAAETLLANSDVRWATVSFLVLPGDGGVTPPGALEITTTSLPGGLVGQAYSESVEATGGSEPYAWAVISGSLPDGLSLNASTGAITGTPTTVGISTFTVQVTDDESETDTQELSIEIAALAITTESLPLGRVGEAYSATLEAEDGVEPYTWAITEGSLPTGLSLNASTGAITGTPTESGDFPLTVQVTDDESETDTAELTLSILAAGDEYTDFSEYTTGALPAEWSQEWDDGASYRIEENAGATGGKRFHQQSALVSATLEWVKWTIVSDGLNQRVEAIVRVDGNPLSTRNHIGVIVRGSGAETSEYGYLLNLRFFTSPSVRSIRLSRIENGTVTVLRTQPIDGSTTSNWAREAYHHLVLEAIEGSIRGKIWEVGSAEPEEWMILVTDPDPLPAGGVGIAGGRGTNNENNYVDTFRYTTDPDPGITAPDAPTIESADCPLTTLSVITSEFSTSDPDPSHSHSRYQVRLDGATDWDTLVVPEFVTTTQLTAATIDGMPELEDLEVRAAHAQDGIWGDWSDPFAFSSGTETPLPDTPTITDPVDEVGHDYVIATRSAFDHAEGVGDGEPDEDGDLLPYLLAVQWQIREAGDSWDNAVIDTGLDSLYAEGVTEMFEGLAAATNYEIRTRYQDGKYGATSLWSPEVAFSTDAIPAVQPATPTLTVDLCAREGAEVSGTVFSHPEGGTHEETRWWVGGPGDDPISWRSWLTTTDLTSFVWPQLPPGDVYLAVSYKDDSGRWSERSDAVLCVVREMPPAPTLVSIVQGAVISEDTLITWEMPAEPDAAWSYSGEISDDNGLTWSELFPAQTDAEHLFEITGRPNGRYLLRIKACYPDELADCSEWLMIPLGIDRTGVVTVSYRFADYEELPATWVPKWDPDGDITWALVDRDLVPVDEVGAGAPYGIHARHTVNLEQRQGVLAFTELGEPDTLDMTVNFAILQNPNVGYFWRYTQSRYTAAGVAYAALDASEVAGDHKSGFGIRVDPGSRSWPHQLPGCGCTSDSPGLCELAFRAYPIVVLNHPNKLWRFATGQSQPGVQMRGYREQRDRHWTYQSAQVPTEGALPRGMSWSRQREDSEQDCRWRHSVYSLRQQITRTEEGLLRVVIQVYGPGIDTSLGPQVDRTYDPDQVLPSDPSWSLSQLPCGSCGLLYWQLPYLTGDPGVLFLSASMTLPDDFILSGPTLGAPTIVEDG